MPPERLLLVVEEGNVLVVDAAGDNLGLIWFGDHIVTSMDPPSIVTVSALQPYTRWRLECRRHFVLPVWRHRRRLS